MASQMALEHCAQATVKLSINLNRSLTPNWAADIYTVDTVNQAELYPTHSDLKGTDTPLCWGLWTQHTKSGGSSVHRVLTLPQGNQVMLKCLQELSLKGKTLFFRTFPYSYSIFNSENQQEQSKPRQNKRKEIRCYGENHNQHHLQPNYIQQCIGEYSPTSDQNKWTFLKVLRALTTKHLSKKTDNILKGTVPLILQKNGIAANCNEVVLECLLTPLRALH